MSPIVSSQSVSLDPEKRCCLLEQVINSDTIFSLPSLRWNSTDSITIFDQSGYFSSSICHVNLEKKIGWKQRDFLPSPLLGDWDKYPEARDKYDHYYVFEKPLFSGNLISIIFTRLLSNHKGVITYRYENGNFSLVDSKIIQY
jgi:hypothetical protein